MRPFGIIAPTGMCLMLELEGLRPLSVLLE